MFHDAAFRPLSVGTSTTTETCRDPQFGQRIRPPDNIEIGQSLPRAQIRARRSFPTIFSVDLQAQGSLGNLQIVTAGYRGE